MKKLYSPLFTAIFMIFIGQGAFSQKITPEDALKLVTENAPSLHLTKEEVQNSIVTNAYTDKVSQLQLVYLQQTFQKVPVYNQIQVIAFKNGAPVSVKGGRIYRIADNIEDKKAIPSISSKEAVVAAAAAVNISMDIINAHPLTILKTSPNEQKIEFTTNAISRKNIISALMWVPTENGKVRLAWQVRILPIKTADYWLIRIDAKNAKVLGKDNLTVTCNWDLPIEGPRYFEPLIKDLLESSPKLPAKDVKPVPPAAVLNSAQYRVIPFPAESMVHPGGTPAIVIDPWLMAGAGNAATTLKWHNDGTTEYNYTRGNNVLAWEDLDGDDDGTGNTPSSSTALPNLTFDFTYDEHAPISTGDNLNAAITNLFYWNNIIHDVTYQYGFDELAGNFQNDNMGRGGDAGDFVVADAQDGSSTNNAIFATGPDGINGHMQMYLWDSYFMATFDIPAIGDFYAVEGNISNNNHLIDIGPVSGDVVLYLDDTTLPTHEACVPPNNAAALAGNIALIDRGNCDFILKIKNAQDAGAIGVLIINNIPGQLFVMGGTPDNSITIPAVMILQGLGADIKDALDNPATIRVTLKDKGSLDGDFDNGIISHEYAHGISNRLTGGPATASCLQNAEQMGEGWSDYFALMLTTNWQTASVSDGAISRGIGNYVKELDPLNGSGIRTYPYSTDISVNPLTYEDLDDIDAGNSHDVGEIWAATLWDMTWNMIQIDGINTNLYHAAGVGGNSASMKIVMLGMKLQPCSPGFLDGRDALLKADDILYNGKYHCAIWNAFARRGMGVLAKQGSAFNTIDQVPNFDIPSGAPIRKTANMTESPQNGTITYTFTVTSQCAGISNYKIVDTLDNNVTYVSGGAYNAGDRTVTFNVPNLAPMESTVFNLTVKVNEGTFFAATNPFSETVATNGVPFSLIATSDDPTHLWDGTTVNHSSPFAVKSGTTGEPAVQILTSAASFLIDEHTQLSFWQEYITEPGKDGGVVELSLDGVSWFDAGPYMAQNGYNATINTNSGLDGKQAFSGNSSTFIQTVINLSEFQGQNIYFRFRYVTDSTGSSLGWFIDDILITKSPAVYNAARVFNSGNVVQSFSDTITAITNVVLPVTWSGFTVAKEGNHARLRWSTAQEFNSNKFIVQRSNDGIGFTNIAILDAAGNSIVNRDYTYLDEAPRPGVNFYRIQQTDLDGNAHYSQVKSLSFDGLGYRILLTPNPAKNDVLLKIAGNHALLTIKLIDVSGREMKSFSMNGEKLYIPLSSLSAGVYYLSISGKGVDSMKKLVKE